MERDLTIHLRLEGACEVHKVLDELASHAEMVSERVRSLYRETAAENIDRHDEFLEPPPEAAPKMRMATYDGTLGQ